MGGHDDLVFYGGGLHQGREQGDRIGVEAEFRFVDCNNGRAACNEQCCKGHETEGAVGEGVSIEEVIGGFMFPAKKQAGWIKLQRLQNERVEKWSNSLYRFFY